MKFKKIGDLDKVNNPIIWDTRDLNIKCPDWAINPNVEVKRLANYFVTFDGSDLINVIKYATLDAKEDLISEALIPSSTSYF